VRDSDLWIFAYGSLMWRPGFAHAERRRATLAGYRRRFCMTSIHYRGTPERPGLVLALAPEPDGLCRGLAYRVPAPEAAEVHAYLRERELVSYAYREDVLDIELEGGPRVPALVYVSDPDHPQFLGGLDLDEQAAIIAAAEGPMGPNRDYLFRTAESLAALGLADPEIETLCALVRRRVTDRGGVA
jgi:cation transport protein ChaC